MATSIAPIAEGITVGQAARAAERFQTRCRVDGSKLPTDVVQDVLEQEGDELAKEQFLALRARVERRVEMIVRRVTINRARTPEQMIAALSRTKYVRDDVLATMPGQAEVTEEVDVYFFPAKRDTPVADVAAKFASYGLVPDHYAQIQVNADDPSFADEHPNGSQWQDADGNYCFVSFCRWRDERGVDVYRLDSRWVEHWWFAGVRKPAAPAAE